MLKRRDQAEISISFLDVICCGFGAIILLLMITKIVEPIVLEESTVNLEGSIADLQENLFEIRGETRVLNRDLTVKNEQLSKLRQKVARLRGDLFEIRLHQSSTCSGSSSGKLQSPPQIPLGGRRSRDTALSATAMTIVVSRNGLVFLARFPG